MASELDVAEIKMEAAQLVAAGVRGQHSNNRVIRLCIEVERLRERLVRLHAIHCTEENCVLDGGEEHQKAFPERNGAQWATQGKAGDHHG